MSVDEDTETLIALLLSTLDPPFPDQSVLLDALANCNGDIKAAGATIRAVSFKRGQKRKRSNVNLKGWLLSPATKASSSTGRERSAERAYERHTSPLREVQAEVNTTQSPLQHESSHGSSSKKTVDLMSILKPPPPTSPQIARLPPLTLSTSALVAQHTPCTLHTSILPPDLACRLFYAMIDESHRWERNKWWLFDRVVESPHRTSFYARRLDGVDKDTSWQEAAQFWYNGKKTEPPKTFLPEMEEACRYIEGVVNEEMCKRKRFPLEWGGSGTEGQTWRANVAASNCYEGTKESVGFHSDQLTYLGPYPTIASLSLGTTRIFRLREVVPTAETKQRHARTYNVPLTHNSLMIMHASTQERFKHSIPPQPTIDMFRPPFPRTYGVAVEPSNCRINITFRFYRPDFRPGKIPRCKCGVPTILRPDMKNRQDGTEDKYWWTCYAGAQNDGKGCNFWKVMDVEAEGRGPFVGCLDC